MDGDPKPFYQAHVFVCTNESAPRAIRAAPARKKGSEKLRDYMKARAKELGFPETRINSAGCLERCEFGPTLVIYPEGVWYSPKTREDIDEILGTHMQQGKRVERLMLKYEDRAPPKPKA